MKTNRKNILLIWLLLGMLTSAISAMASMIYWELTYTRKPNVEWSPIDDTVGMFVIMPFGWVMSIITPAGWFSIIGLGIAIYRLSLKPLVVSVAGSVTFGLFWPKYFVAMMGI